MNVTKKKKKKDCDIHDPVQTTEPEEAGTIFTPILKMRRRRFRN